jgi:hypothetical protein
MAIGLAIGLADGLADGWFRGFLGCFKISFQELSPGSIPIPFPRLP